MSHRRGAFRGAVMAWGLAAAVLGAQADEALDRAPAAEVWSLHGQVTVISQGHGSFPARYTGTNSLDPTHEVRTSFTATIFIARRLWPGSELVVDAEATAGRGLSDVTGIAGFPNGDITRVSSPDPKIYLARAFLRQTWNLGGGVETVEPDANVVAGTRMRRRLVLLAGKLAVTDLLDTNRYSHDPRTQFMNWSLMSNAAWDYPADTRGYTWGLGLELTLEDWSARAGSFMVPREANGLALDHDVAHAHADVIEIERRFAIGGHPGKVAVLGFRNNADAGTYRDAISLSPDAPDVTSTRRPGTRKYGYGLNVQQEVADGIGLFGRWGWSDGRTETWAFTEVDRTWHVGAQVAGSRWGRPDDSIGIAVVNNGLAPAHRDYLAAGGHGFIVGDGQLNYDREKIVEMFISVALGRGFSITGDVQRVVDPAYNRDRGPVTVWAARLHWSI